MKNTFYRFLNSTKTNQLRFTTLLASDIVNNDLKKLTDEKRTNVFIVDQTKAPIELSRNKIYFRYGKSQLVITIGRSFGSGGREIGKKLAEELDMAYYDKEILEKVAKHPTTTIVSTVVRWERMEQYRLLRIILNCTETRKWNAENFQNFRKMEYIFLMIEYYPQN